MNLKSEDLSEEVFSDNEIAPILNKLLRIYN
jgi:hypothetical protein